MTSYCRPACVYDFISAALQEAEAKGRLKQALVGNAQKLQAEAARLEKEVPPPPRLSSVARRLS